MEKVTYGEVNGERIEQVLHSCQSFDMARVEDICQKAETLTGLDMEEVACLLSCTDSQATDRIFQAARKIKNLIYGRRLVLFAPLYVSNLCSNECAYCAFRVSNRAIKRKVLSQEEIAEEVGQLVSQGHKRVLLVAGESYPRDGLNYILQAIRTIYDTKVGRGEVRRVNVNIAPLTVDQFKELHGSGIGTYQLFQETYHPETYRKLHPRGPKANYGFRLDTMDRALQAGIDDVGIGILFGLADHRWEVLALLDHIRHLEDRFGIGPHTVSVPRLEPADGSELASNPPNPVSDEDFKLIVAVLRLAVPYTGIILSTRESARMRRDSFDLGVSQISAGSKTNPGGYQKDHDGKVIEHKDGEGSGMGQAGAQFSLGDHRSLDEVIRDICEFGHIPSFCTGCYRLGRTGHDFMGIAKLGHIKNFCLPNALTTFQEYLEDYASEETRKVGEPLVQTLLAEIENSGLRDRVSDMLANIGSGERDLYV